MRRDEIEVIRSVGIEFEFISSIQNKLMRDSRFDSLGFVVTHDASSETPARALGELPIEPSKNSENTSIKIPGTQTVKLGGELVSNILYNDGSLDIYEKLKKLTSLLHEYGEPHRAERSGIHLHFAYVDKLEVLKSVIVLAAHLEKVFFTLGGMGYENRGLSNDAIYIRPITKKGPLVVPLGDGKFGQCFTIESLLKSKTTKEFFYRYGDVKQAGRNTRYFPVRYHWINLANLVRKKHTLEFRIFNITLNPMAIWAVMQFCSCFAKFCLENTVEALHELGFDKENSVFDEQAIEEILAIADAFMTTAGMDEKAYYIILELLTNSPPPTFEEYFVHCHLTGRNTVVNHFVDSKYRPKEISLDDVRKPGFTDYHTLGGRR